MERLKKKIEKYLSNNDTILTLDYASELIVTFVSRVNEGSDNFSLDPVVRVTFKYGKFKILSSTLPEVGKCSEQIAAYGRLNEIIKELGLKEF